jgi:chemosensory pili system protein ChpA (sensor histidine kinase/response regulator)
MSVGNELDINTLSWVKSEIDETLNQARTALEAYVEDPEDESRLQFCFNYLHQVRGTLQMVELYGATMAAEEMEILTQALLDKQVNNREDAYEVLMRGILQLPDYLEHLLAGHQDIPVVLMPLLNDLRAARGEALLSENALFAPDLTVDAPTNEMIATDIIDLARKLRHNYHLGLLGWFRDKDSEASLKRIGDVIEKLRQAAGEQEINRLLWVAGGLVESLKHGGINSSVSIKLLLGQLDRQIKKIIDNGITALSDEPPLELLKNLLYYVATSQSSDERTREVKHAFKLDQVMPDTHTLEQARADLAGPNAALMGTVSAVLLEDLTRVKDTLDVFMRKEERDTAELKPLCDTLNQMSDTLGMMGLGLQRRMVQDQIEVLRAMANGERELQENTLMDVAGAMLSLETSLQEASVARAANEEAEEVGEAGDAQQKLRAAEQQQLLRTVIEQAGDELAHVKDALNDFSRNTASAEVLQSIPPTLDQIRGSLAILDLQRAAQLLDRCTHYVRTELLEKRFVPEEDALNAFADAVSSIEYYLESLAGKWGHPETILDIAEKSLQTLDEYIQSGEAATQGNVADQVEGTEEPDIDLSSMELVMPGFDDVDTHQDLQAPDDDTLQNLITPAIVDETDGTSGPVSDQEDTLTDISASGVLDSSLDLLEPTDTDHTQILNVNELSLEGLDADTEAEQSGSSPASTAKQSSEPITLQDLPLPAEDTTSPKSSEPQVDNSLSLELNGFDENPTMTLDANALQQQSSGEELSFDNEFGSQQNESVSLEIEGLELEDDSDMPAAAEGATTAAVAVDLSNESSSSISSIVEPPEDIDDEIIEIFLEEAEEEFHNISHLLSQWQADQSNQDALKDMRRSFHTLKGSGRLVGAKDLGEFAWAFENMLNRVIDKTIEVLPVMFEVLNQGRDTLPHLFELFKTGGRADQPVLALMSVADDLSQGKEVEWVAAEPTAAPAAEAEIEFTETLSPEIETPETDVAEAELEIVESMAPQAEDAEFELSLDEVPQTTVSEIASAATPLPDIDPVLLDIYRKEVETHLNTLKQYFAGWHANIDRSANDNLLRAFHTLTGSSRTTGVQEVSEICSRFEKFVKALQKNKSSVHAEAVEVLEQTIKYIENITAQLDQPGAVIASNTEILQSVEALSTGDADERPSMEILVEETALDEIEAEDQGTAAELEDVSSIEQPAAVTLAPRDYDEELLEIFVEEGEEILEESDHTLTSWMENTNDSEALEALQRHLHTLKGGARMAGVLEIGDLGHSIESMLTAVVDGHLQVSKSLFAIMQQAQDRLAHLLEQVKTNQGLAPANDIIAQVDEILGRSSLGKDARPETTYQTQAVTDETAAGTVSESQTELEVQADEPDLASELEALADALQFDDATTAAESNSIVGVDTLTPEVQSASESLTKQNGLSAEKSEAPPARTDTDNVVALKTQRPLGVEVEKPAVTTDEDQTPEQDRRKTPRVQHEQVRVRADLLDNLVNFAGEVSIYRSRMEQQTNSFRYNLRELDDTVSRLRHQLRAFEIETEAQIQYRKEETLSQAQDDFDPLEFDRFTQMQQLSRGMLESLSDLDSLRAILANITRESETLLLQQSRVNTELQEGLMRTRMVPFAGQAPRLRRIVRQTSSEMGKHVELKLLGMEGELDRTVLDRVISPIEHMLRNAIAHGIESPAQRREMGKPETGNINLSFTREGSDIVIQVSDDGAGINLEAIQKKAIEKGLLKPGSKVAKDVLLNMIMESGFSTAEQVTQVAGRGVGMDVVNTEIKQLGGLLSIDTERGKGTTFTINMPLTLAITRALMVNVGEENYAIPLLSVHGVERISAEELQALQAEERPAYRWLEEDYPLMHLGSVLGISKPVPSAENQKITLLLVRSGEHRAAIQVEGILGSREVVVKPVGPQLSTLSGITGATIMGDGQVMLILDLGVLIRLMATTAGGEVIEVPATPAEKIQTKQVVMVVDDSITVRKVTTRLLERNDYEVLTAKDGVDALAQLQEHRPDVILLDVEMPRMDGFELATNVRNDAELKGIPIIMITSRTASKHRQRAMDIGVNEYMGKPYNESDLLANIENLVSK